MYRMVRIKPAANQAVVLLIVTYYPVYPEYPCKMIPFEPVILRASRRIQRSLHLSVIGTDKCPRNTRKNTEKHLSQRHRGTKGGLR